MKINEYLNQSTISLLNFFDIINRPKIIVKKKYRKKKKNKTFLITGAGGSIEVSCVLKYLNINQKDFCIRNFRN